MIQAVAPDGKVAILCGKGNNAGDGYVIARHLDLLGRAVTLVSIVHPEELSGDAAINAAIARRSQLDLRIARDRQALGEAISGAARSETVEKTTFLPSKNSL